MINLTELKDAIVIAEENAETIKTLCIEFNCVKVDLLAVVGQWKEEQTYTNKEKIIELLNSLKEAADDAYSQADSTNEKVCSATSEMEYVDSEDTMCAIDDITSRIDTALGEISSKSETSEED